MKFKQILINNLFNFFPKTLDKVFNFIYRYKLNSNLNELLKKKIKIQIVYDIGAYKGGWSKFLNNTSLKGREFYLFEANPQNKKYLKKLNFKYFIKVLSDKVKEIKFYSNSGTGDSYYLEQTSFYRKKLKPKKKITDTLDNIVKKEKLPKPNFVKIDTQGSEIDILKGGKKTISNCSLVHLECPVINYNLGAPNLDEYIKYLNSIDFVPYDICEVHYSDKVVIQVDILFIKKSIILKINPNKKNLNILRTLSTK